MKLGRAITTWETGDLRSSSLSLVTVQLYAEAMHFPSLRLKFYR